MAIFAGVFFRGMWAFPGRLRGAIAALLGIAFYTLLVGAGPPVS